MVITQSADQSVWHVLFTLSRHEKKVHSNLLKREITSFLPLQQQYRQWTDRKKKLSLPLFPNYVFVKIDSHDKFRVFEVPGVIRYLDSNISPTVISQNEIDLIQMLLKGEIEVTNETLQVSDKVMITSGPLKGLKGVLSNKKGAKRIVVEINSIHKKLSVDISPFYVQRIPERVNNFCENVDEQRLMVKY